MLGFNLTDPEFDELSDREVKFLVKEYCRKHIVEGYHRDEIALMVRREFQVLFSAPEGEKPRFHPSTIQNWLTTLVKDVVDVEVDNRRHFNRNLSVAQQRLEHMYNICMRKGDRKMALRVLKELHMLQGISDGKIVVNFGMFQQNNINGSTQQEHTSGSAPQYTQFSHLSDEELKQKAITHQPQPTTFDVLQQIEEIQSNSGMPVHVPANQADALIDAHNKNSSKPTKS